MARKRLRHPSCKLTSIRETSEERRVRLAARRERQRDLLPGYVVSHPIDRSEFQEYGTTRDQKLGHQRNPRNAEAHVDACRALVEHQSKIAVNGLPPKYMHSHARGMATLKRVLDRIEQRPAA